MLGLPIAFVAPAVLVALVGLGLLYYLLRVSPPPPRRIVFPPLRLLLGLDPKEAEPARSPWPITVLRLLVGALIILAMAQPLWNSLAGPPGGGPLLVLIDDSWAAAPTFETRVAYARQRIDGAAHSGRLVAIQPLSAGGQDIAPLDPSEAEGRLRSLAPQPYAPPRKEALPAVQRFLARQPAAEILWIADGIELGEARGFADGLNALTHSVSVVTDGKGARALAGAENEEGSLNVRLTRSSATTPETGSVHALDAQGREVGRAEFAFGAGLTTTARFELPVELRNEVTRVTIDGERSTGATWLVDERSRRKRIAIASGASADVAQPLLAPSYYLRRALQPFADVIESHDSNKDPILALLAEKPSMLVLADMTVPSGPVHDAVAQFVENGGVLLRFAGSRLAAGNDDMTPTDLRRGGRLLGGALSWDAPKHIGPFEQGSPFFGLAAPEEVTVNRQVLAEPDAALAGKTWARLADGTPLVTADRRGKGLVVLFHVTADTTWSNLPLSGLFVDMLKRIAEKAPTPGAVAPEAGHEPQAAGQAESLAPWRTLDGVGTLGQPPARAEPIAGDFAGVGDARHPPGFYGPQDSLRAVNAMADGQALKSADYGSLKVKENALQVAPPIDLRRWLLPAALVGLLLDALASLWLARGSGFRRPAVVGALVLAALLAGFPAPQSARAAEAVSPRDMNAALSARLAYVTTGDPTVDETSKRGLIGLTRVLSARTSAELAEPVGVDPSRDELAFYPMLYWPIVADRPQPKAEARVRLAAFMRNGGTVVFDTRDALVARPDGPPTREALWLRTLLAGVDVPGLEPVPRDHVLTKTFYLLDRIVGRTAVGQTWIEALPPVDPNDRRPKPARAGDDVSPIIIASDDLAAAWASDDSGRPLFPLVPGGARERELALRSGVNLVMYTLTGNYKADQVHAKDIIERLTR